jgi:hypothetical protein
LFYLLGLLHIGTTWLSSFQHSNFSSVLTSLGDHDHPYLNVTLLSNSQSLRVSSPLPCILFLMILAKWGLKIHGKKFTSVLHIYRIFKYSVIFWHYHNILSSVVTFILFLIYFYLILQSISFLRIGTLFTLFNIEL